MVSNVFYEGNSRVLTQEAFDFVLASELRRALRSQNFLTLVVLEARHEADGAAAGGDDVALREEGTVQEVAEIVGREVRDTDPLGHTGPGTLSIVLLDADLEHSSAVMDRLVSRLQHYAFPSALQISVGAACYPTHAAQASSLKHQAMSNRLVHWRAGIAASAEEN